MMLAPGYKRTVEDMQSPLFAKREKALDNGADAIIAPIGKWNKWREKVNVFAFRYPRIFIFVFETTIFISAVLVLPLCRII